MNRVGCSRDGDRWRNEDERTCRSKDIATGKLPHSCQKLRKTAREAGHADNDVGGVDVSCVYIVHRENERG